MTHEAVEAATAALLQGRLSDALARMTEGWAEVRDPRLAAMIERLGDVLEPLRPPVDLVQPRTSQQRWLEREGEGHPADSGLLAVHFTTGAPGKALWQQRVQRLVERTPDPRVFRAIMKQVRGLPFAGYGANYSKVLARHADPRAVGDLVLPRSGHRSWSVDEWNKRMARLERAMRKLDIGPLDGSDALEAALEAALKGPQDRWLEVTAATRDQVLDGLWDLVTTDPADDAARLVFADRVAEVDDAWALFIHRQLDAETTDPDEKTQKQLKKVLKARHADWLGPLTGRVGSTGLRFRRGFLDAGLVITSSNGDAETLGDAPQWRTASALWSKHTGFFRGAALVELESVGCKFVRQVGTERWVPNPGGKALTAPQFRKLCKEGPLVWPVVQVSGTPSAAETLIPDLPRLAGSAVQTVVLVGMTIDEGIADALPPIREIVVGPDSIEPEPFVRAVPTLTAFTMVGMYRLRRHDDGDWRLTFTDPTPEERRMLLRGSLSPNEYPAVAERLRQMLEAAGRGGLIMEGS